jgi:hypothetical protein
MNFFSTLRGMLLHDFGWKVLSAVLAATIWFTVHRNLIESKIVLPTARPDGGLTATNNPLPAK